MRRDWNQPLPTDEVIDRYENFWGENGPVWISPEEDRELLENIGWCIREMGSLNNNNTPTTKETPPIHKQNTRPITT